MAGENRTPLLTLSHSLLRGSSVKNPPVSAGDLQEAWVQSLGRENPLEKELATHSSILAWKIPWTEEPGGAVHGVAKESDMTEHDTRAKSWNFKSDISFELKLVFVKFRVLLNKEMI